MKKLLLFLACTACALAQYQAVPSTAYPALEAILNAKGATTSGSGAPTSACTTAKDFYVDTTNVVLYYCSSTNVWSSAPGILSGSGAPGGGVGVNGSFYLDTSATCLYGPKSGTWPSCVALIGPTGPTGTVAADAEYATSQMMTSADCPFSLKTFTGSSALTYTLITPIAGCSIAVQNNTSQTLTLNLTTNSVTGNSGNTANVTLAACPSQPSGCYAAVLKAHGTSNWDISFPGAVGPAGATGATGSAGAGTYSASGANTGAVSMTGSNVPLWTISSVPTLAAGACYTFSGAIVGAGTTGVINAYIYVDAIQISNFVQIGSPAYDQLSEFKYCNNPGSQTAQTIGWLVSAYSSAANFAAGGTNTTQWSEAPYRVPAAVNWAATHTIYVYANATSGSTVTGVWFAIN